MNRNTDIVDLKPRLADFREEVLNSLLQTPKSISPKFFYDETGSRLFDEITRLEEYYPTRSELEILETKCPDIAEFIGNGALVIELGGGNGMKGTKLLRCIRSPEAYVLVDISRDSLQEALERMSAEHSDVDVRAIWADYTDPKVMKELELPGRKAIVFLGSTIGNMEPASAAEFLTGCRGILREGETLTIGVDLKKDTGILERAYNDSRGITAEFNLNLISRIKNAFGSSINPSAFKHLAFYNVEKGRIEMHLESLAEQEFTLDGHNIRFFKGETVHTENSYKYSVEEFSSMLNKSGFSEVGNWTDSKGNYALFWARA